VVAPLENLTGDPSLDHVGRIAADWLTQGIAQTESVTVVSSAAAAMAIDGARGSYAQLVQRLVTTTGATHLVSGSVVRRGDSLQLQVQLTDSRTGRLLRTIDPAIGPTRDPIEAIDALRERVMGALAAEQRTGDSTALLTVRAPKYSAYREFVEGAERFRRFQDYGAAIPRFERAVALDSTFAVAWQYLAVSHVNLGEYAAADTLLPRIEALRDRLGPSERDMLEWQRASLKGDWDEALRRAQVMSARDSSPIGLYLVGLHANRLLRPRLAVPALLAADARMAIGGWVPQIGVLAESYHQLGRHDDELATLARGRRLYPTNRALLARGLRAYAALRRPDAALALADTVLRTASDSLGADVARVLTGAAEFRAHGDSATARRLAELAVTWHAANRPRAVGPVRAERAGMAFLQAGRPDSAERHLALAARDTACCAVAYLAALRFERGGDTAALLRVADSLGADARKWTFGQNRFAQAGLLARVDRERAMAALRAAVREGYTMQSLHYAPLLAPLRGLPAFEALVTPQR
jgi:TolB-like protein